MPEPLLVGRELTFRYGKQSAPIFSNLSLTVEEGETVLLMGPSGCGKSTLAYCLAGLYPEYAGELAGTVRLAGRPLESYGPAARARTVSILFQNPDNQFCMDRVDHEVLFALENINYPGDLRARMEELLEKSLMLVTCLTPHIGYEKAAACAKAAHKEGITLREAVLRTGLLTEADYERIVDPAKMV